MENSNNHFDIVIVGAGLSGIGAARLLQDKCPTKTFAILEARDSIGGTWDLFRYPGIRSDSDMYTMGYDSKPWLNPKAIADGPSILAYVKEAAAERGIGEHIYFGHKVQSADWSSGRSGWALTAHRAKDGKAVQFSCNFLYMCSGYYDCGEGYTPKLDGLDEFRGSVVHPQKWPEELNFAGKKVVVVGSGATAMTLVPAMAETAAHVTLLQRSPTYVVSLPSRDAIAEALKKYLPESLAYKIIRWKNVQFQRYVYHQTRVNPKKVAQKLLSLVRKHLGPNYDIGTHFTPKYKPWDQRMCLVPDGDLFKAITSGKATMVTDGIERFTSSGVRLRSGSAIDADIIVTATGLNLLLLGGAEFSVDGERVQFPETWSYKGMMFSGVPNLVYTLGYINASWTLRSELVAEYVCRLLNRMDEIGASRCTPRLREEDVAMNTHPLTEYFSPGYIRRGAHLFPLQADNDPWRNTQNYATDKKIIRHSPIEDGVLDFGNSPVDSGTVEPELVQV
jgi:cation diffusion facilitator CzcD-associated flavoprotein CzcO